MGELINLYDTVATCPECGCQEWYIHVDGFGDDFKHVTAHACANCEYKVDIEIIIEREEVKS